MEGRRGWWIQAAVLAAAVALAWTVMGGHPSFGSSVRYSEACREMLATGDWLVPRLHYAPYLEKPPLTYWLGAGSMALFGESWRAVHLPAALAALVSGLAAWRLAAGLRGGAFPLAAGLFLLGSAMTLVMSTVLTTDPLLSAALAVAWLAYARHDRRPEGAWVWAFWAALGVGVLAKGPVAVVLAACAVAAFHLVADGPLGVLRALVRLRPLRGTALLLAINLPWWLAVWRHDPRFIEYFLVRFNLEAFYTAKVNHTGPLWLYPAVIAAAFTPWTVPVLAALGVQAAAAGQGVWGRWRQGVPVADRQRLFLVCALIAPLLFLTVSRSKLGTYVMPLFPLVAVLALDALWRAGETARRWPLAAWAVQAVPIGLATVAAVAAVALGLVPSAWTHGLDPAWLSWLAVAAALLGAGQVAALVLVRRGAWGPALAAAGVGAALAALLAVPVMHRAVPELVSTPVAGRVAALAGPDDLVAVTEPYVHDYHLAWGLGRRLSIAAEPREVGMGLFVEQAAPGTPIPADPYDLSAEAWPRLAPGTPPSPWLVSQADLRAAWASPRRVWLFTHRRTAEALAAEGLAVHALGRTRNQVAITNQPLPAGHP